MISWQDWREHCEQFFKTTTGKLFRTASHRDCNRVRAVVYVVDADEFIRLSCMCCDSGKSRFTCSPKELVDLTPWRSLGLSVGGFVLLEILFRAAAVAFRYSIHIFKFLL